MIWIILTSVYLVMFALPASAATLKDYLAGGSEVKGFSASFFHDTEK